MDSIHTRATAATGVVATHTRKRIFHDRRGSTTIEYALLAATIATVAMIGLAPFGSSLAQEFYSLSSNHLFQSSSNDLSGGCRRVEWVEPELVRHHHLNR